MIETSLKIAWKYSAIFGNLQTSSEILENDRKCMKFRQSSDTFQKSSEIFGRSSEIFGKLLKYP